MKRKYSSSTGCPTSNIAVLQGVPHQIEQFYRVSHIKYSSSTGCPTSNIAVLQGVPHQI